MIHLFTFEADWFTWSFNILKKYDWYQIDDNNNKNKDNECKNNTKENMEKNSKEVKSEIKSLSTQEMIEKGAQQFQWLSDLANDKEKFIKHVNLNTTLFKLSDNNGVIILLKSKHL